MPSTSWFGRSISYEYVILAPQDRQGGMTSMDFATWRDLKRRVRTALKSFSCPFCGRQKVSGSGVEVHVGKIHLYKQVESKGWLGGVKHKEKFDRTVWRIHEIGLHTAPGRHIFNFFALLDDVAGNRPGQLKCNARGCSWSESGGREGTQTLGEFLHKFKS